MAKYEKDGIVREVEAGSLLESKMAKYGWKKLESRPKEPKPKK